MAAATNTPADMNALYQSAGRVVLINDEERTVTAVRACYGTALELTLDRPLTGCTSNLFSVDGHTCWKVRF